MPRKPAKKSKAKSAKKKSTAKAKPKAKAAKPKAANKSKPAKESAVAIDSTLPTSAPEKVARLGIDRSDGAMYFLKETEVWRMQQGKPEKVADAEFERENGWLYYLDGDGDVVRVKSNQPAVSASHYDEIEE